MAENKQTEQKAAEPTKKESVFSLEQFRKNCTELFGVSASTFAGAIYQLKDGPERRYTIAEMKTIIEKWQNAAIKVKEVE